MTPTLVGLCGTQGCGKTTLLKAIRSPLINVAQNTSSRSTLADLKITFDKSFYSNPDLIATFQVRVLKNMCAFHLELLQQPTGPTKAIITDRTYMDLDAYLMTNLGMYPEYETFINRYHHLCVMLSSLCFDSIIMMPFPRFQIPSDQVDATRPSSSIHQRQIHNSMIDLSYRQGAGLVYNRLFDGDTPTNHRVTLLEKYLLEEMPKVLKNRNLAVQANRPLLLNLIMNSIDSIINGDVSL